MHHIAWPLALLATSDAAYLSWHVVRKKAQHIVGGLVWSLSVRWLLICFVLELLHQVRG